MSRAIDIEIDEDLLDAVESRAAATGKSTSEVVEEAIRNYLGLGALTGIWAKTESLPEEAAMNLALEAQGATRKKR